MEITFGSNDAHEEIKSFVLPENVDPSILINGNSDTHFDVSDPFAKDTYF